jgi:hypothetical protein
MLGVDLALDDNMIQQAKKIVCYGVGHFHAIGKNSRSNAWLAIT